MEPDAPGKVRAGLPSGKVITSILTYLALAAAGFQSFRTVAIGKVLAIQ
jgi:hypothetical protein